MRRLPASSLYLHHRELTFDSTDMKINQDTNGRVYVGGIKQVASTAFAWYDNLQMEVEDFDQVVEVLQKGLANRQVLPCSCALLTGFRSARLP